jgi:hypothetical protein
MAADAFTQIRNAVFRDSRLSAKAMGIFGNISTHRDGWGITPESISKQMRDGVSAIKAGLRELEEYGYLQRVRERRPDGTLGGSEYFITDQPEALAQDRGRSAPEVDFPPVDEPPVAQPPVGDHSHKKTIPLQEDQLLEDELSLPPLPAQRSEPDPATSEREILSPFEDPTTQQPNPSARVDRYTAQPADTDDTTQVAAAWAEAYKRSSNGNTPSVKAVSRVRASAASRLRAGKTTDELTLIAVDMAQTNLAWTDLAEHEAHWLNKQQAVLTGTDTTVIGRCPVADQLRPSTTDARVQAALDIGRRLQAEHDAVHGYQPYRQPTPEDYAADLGHF